ncbi:MAG: histidine phosphatase family protein [Gammaproteobacteria bacterium]|nr:histidine phosphatase family protein [Gammaproteobacteria bacterium]
MPESTHKLVVMRHGQAEPRASSDAQRALTGQGRADSQAAAAGIAEFFGDARCIQAIYHSPFLRTTQTAAELGDKLCADAGLPRLVAADDLLGGQTPQQVLDWLDAQALSSVVLVSHQPLVSTLLAYLLDADCSGSAGREYPMAPASYACLEFEVAGAGAFSLAGLYHADRYRN